MALRRPAQQGQAIAAKGKGSGIEMGMVIEFPHAASGKARRAVATDGQASAQVVILPVIRIERYEDQPAEIFAPVRDTGRKRRRRAAR